MSSIQFRHHTQDTGLSFFSSVRPLELTAQPRGRNRDDDYCDRIPFRTEFGSAIPCRERAGGSQNESEQAENNGVFMGILRCESRRDVAASQAINGSIRERQQKQGASHGLTKDRKYSCCVHQRVGGSRNNNDECQPRQHCTGASENTTWLLNVYL